jgi:AsmA protein
VVLFAGNVDMKPLKIAGAAVAAVIAVVALLLVIGIPSGFLSSIIQDRVERQTGYRLTIAGSTKLSLWPTLNIKITDLTVQDPKDRDGSNRVTIGSVEADMTFSSIWSGHPHLSELIITRPVLYKPLLRERTRDPSPGSSRPALDAGAVTIDRVKIVEGAAILSNQRDHVENRIEGIDAEATIAHDRTVKLTGTARASGTPLKYDVTAALPPLPLDRQTVPVQFVLDAPGTLRAPLSGNADVVFDSPVIMINRVAGKLGDGDFNGWASVDVASKPQVKVSLDFQHLDLSSPRSTTSSEPISYTWSDAPLNLTGLNYVDAQARISAKQLDIGQAQLAPFAVDATLAGGSLRASVANVGAYGGWASGEVIIDASGSSPTYQMHGDLTGVRALPLLTSLADFDKIDGKMQAKVAAQSQGASVHAIMTNMSGTAFVLFQDGAIRGVNVAQMIRSLTSSTLSGWQEQQDQATDLTQLSASFRADRGQATTTDLSLVGPLVKVTGVGTIDLGTKMIGFRVEPKLVLTTQGQGRAADPVGFGIPVMIEGYWFKPKIYPDMQGILDNPDAAYAKLREMGQGLFSANGSAGLNGLLGGLSALTGNPPANNNSATPGNNGNNNPANPNDPLGGNIGQSLNNLFQKGFANQSRSIPAPRSLQATPQSEPAQTPAQLPAQLPAQASPPPQAAVPDPSPQAQNDNGPQDSQPMNDVLRQLFNR